MARIRRPSSSATRSVSSSVGLLLLVGASCLLALSAQPAQAQLTTLGGDAATLVLDLPEAPAADNITTTDSGTDSGPAGGRKLLGTSYLIKGGGPNGGYVACNSGSAQVLLCYGTPDKSKASKFVVYQYNDMYQFQKAGTTFCLTLFSKPQNQVHLYQCAKPEAAAWYQRWNLYKTVKKGLYTIRTGPTLSAWAFWYPGHGKPFEARAGCNPETSVQCNVGVVQV